MRKTGINVFILFFLLILTASSGIAAETSSFETLAARIDSILGEVAENCTIAVKVVSLDSGETVYERNARRLMVPASNTKLFTTAAALNYLGPDFTVNTSFYLRGDIDERGNLDGDLIIYGRGDPNISGRFTEHPTEIFDQVVDDLKSLGLREIKGDIIGDDSYFDSCYYGPWPAADSQKWYAARVSALSFNDNCIDICVVPGNAPGQKPRIKESPESSYARIINQANTTSRRNNSVWAASGGGSSDVQLRGRIWMGKKEELLNVPVETPALFTATVFKESLQRKGIKVHGRARELEEELGSAVPPGLDPIINWRSLPFSEMIKVVNKRSQNLHAELLLKQIGLRTGRGASFEGGTRAIHEFTQKIGLPVEDIDLHDGSGLCRTNQVTVHSVTGLLEYMDKSPWRSVYRESLATVGSDESLQSMVTMVPPGRVMGKTGSLKGVFAFSGYADGETENFAFSIVANGLKNGSYSLKRARDRICRELVRY
ncbi:MAG: D-alanyl-D-alanine carboxypeptidase/D-alanyl-D-alanine-endopeptidase [Candidatus Abyssobacteria bacterium SURF_5]|uniref:D-alanyl-D-alanine carboxypeptidase/D-alanyl-D-alanine-endopeptidase n=1 Tax=Abyssobacteria bacterium (strain SURF_5) TaxID=2093360 RepID=A0A3A4NZI1_ABYX5|nr:MAG: D-alanyl-D-alanine carboxypeptidase/D-alanyl-D-alanine-endopeptidase [Candidatus Abyssubacteria bacterium SURF_5]